MLERTPAQDATATADWRRNNFDVVRLVAATLVVLFVAASHVAPDLRHVGVVRPTLQDIVGYFRLREEVTFLLVFAVAAGLFLVRDRIALRVMPALVLAGLGAVAYEVGAKQVTVLAIVLPALVLTYGILVLGLRTPGPLHRLTRPGDVSYGIYLVSYPIQQVLIMLLGLRCPPLALFALALTASYLVALPLWHLIERPALRRKPRSSQA